MKRYLLGADGGGSKTAIVLTDLDLNVIAIEEYGRSNPGDIGYEATEQLLVDAFLGICARAGVEKKEVGSIFAGVAGLTSFRMTEQLHATLSSHFEGIPIDCSHDGINVLYGAFPDGRDGAIIICGTGSSCFVKVGASIYRIGGYGQFDLKGNGYELGKAAFGHVFRTLDGRDPYGVLARTLDDQFGGSCHAHIFEINRYTKTEFARFAPYVFEAARAGDPVAQAMLEDHLSYIAELIGTAAGLFGGKPFPVALAGGIFRDPMAIEIVKRHSPALADIFRMEREPYLGAAAKALAQLRGEARLTQAEFVRGNV